MARVELIIGPAGSGKTRYVQAALRSELARQQANGRFGTTLWITPTQRSRRQVLSTLLDGELAVCFGPRVATFEEFAEQILRSAPVAIRPLSQVAKRKLLRDLIDELQRRRQLTYFAGVAGTMGFLDLCISFISELKRAEVWPEDLAEKLERIVERDGGSAKATDRKSQEIALIYDAYQRRLHAADGPAASDEVASGLYDAEGRFWSARTLMQNGHRGPFRELTCVVVDGFTDFTHTQYEILGTLAGWTDHLLVTLPGEACDRDGERRCDLFTKTNASRLALRKTFAAQDVTEVELDLDDASRRTTFGHLAANLFDNPRDAVRLEAAHGLTVISCVRQTGELETVAKRVKTLLLDGVAPEDVVVVFRSLDGNGDRARTVFNDAGVPTAVNCGCSLVAAGSVRFLLSVLDLELEDWPFQKLAGVLNSTLYRPLADFDRDLAAGCVSATLRSMNLDGGLEVILGALTRRSERSGSDVDQSLEVAVASLRLLSDRLELLRHSAPFSDWVDRLLALASSLGITTALGEVTESLDAEVASFEAQAWDTFVRLVEEAKNAERLCGSSPRSLDLAGFRKQLLELLTGQTCNEPTSEIGRVRVLSADQVRNLDVPHLFVCGMSESAFPKSRGDDCLFGDGERHRLTEQGLPLSHRARHSREEMLLFYGVVTRARKTLTLSYPSVDDNGEPLNPSPYVGAILGLFERPEDFIEVTGELDPVPKTASQCASEAELRTYAMSEALDGRAELLGALARRPRSTDAVLNIAAAADMAAARFETRGLTNYEGLLSDPRNLKRLRKRFGVAHEFSATELETYAENPFRFFLGYVLGLDPLSVPGPATDHARRGSALHAALAALHQRMAAESANEVDLETLVDWLREQVGIALPQAGDSPLQRVLRRIEREILSTRASRYGTQWQEYVDGFKSLWDSPPRPVQWEVAFGDAPEEAGDKTGEHLPVVIFGSDDDVVRVRGRIDRIDVGTVGGKAVYTVIDYKLSRSPRTFTADDVACGRALQLVLYAFAARRLGFLEADLFQFGFWSLSGDGFVSGLKRTKAHKPVDPETATSLEQTLDRVLPRLVDSIRNGTFPIAIDDPSEPYYADYAAVARTAAFRSVAEVLDKRLPDAAPSIPVGSET